MTETPLMKGHALNRSRRDFLSAAAFGIFTLASGSELFASEPLKLTVWKDPNCGCCGGWVKHMKRNGFAVTVIETPDVQAIKEKFGVPGDLVSCHTAEIKGYVIEGHVPAAAIKKLISEASDARGLAAPGMPSGSPGMTGAPEIFEVVAFGKERRSFGRFLGENPV